MDLSKLDELKNLNVEQEIEPSLIGKEILTPDGKRNESEKIHFHKVKIILIWLFGGYLIAISFVVVFHLIFSPCYRWLSPDEVASLEKMFFTGIGAGLVGKFGNKLIN